MLLAVGMAATAVVGAALPLWRKPSTLVSSVSLGFAAGVMIATVAFEMLPEALRLASLRVVALGFAAGFGALYGLGLRLHRDRMAGERAEQHEAVAVYGGAALHPGKRECRGPRSADAIERGPVDGRGGGEAARVGGSPWPLGRQPVR